jgi:replicative DNA helicase
MALTDKWNEPYKQQVIDELLPWYVVSREAALGIVDEVVPLAHISELTEAARLALDHAGQIQGLATGFSQLDYRLGGLDKGELIIVSGATGTGKTMFSLNMLLGAHFNQANPMFTTLMFSLEMTKVQLTARIMNLVPEENDPNELPIYFYNSPTDPNLRKMRLAMERCKAEFGLDAVLIDHLHYFSRSIDNQANEIGALVRSIKSLAMEFNIPIILLAHTRKKPTNAPRENAPSLDDLRDSSFIAQDADIVVMLKRDLMDRINSHYLEVFVSKNRNKGHLGKISMLIDQHTFALVECREDA